MAKIFLIEDDKAHLKLHSWSLEDFGYDYLAIPSVVLDLKDMCKRDFDLLIIDSHLSEIKAWEIMVMIPREVLFV